MTSSTELKQIFSAARPLVEQWLDIAEQMAAIRDTASAKGLDWSQIKALLKAQVQDERDGRGDGKRVNRLVEKAEFASAYAGMLGLVNMNEENISSEPHSTAAIQPHAVDSAGAGVAAASSVPASSFVSDNPDAGNLTASRSTPAEGSGFHDPETGEVFDEPEQPLTEAPPSPSPSVIEEGGAAASAPPSELDDDFDNNADYSDATHDDGPLRALPPDFARGGILDASKIGLIGEQAVAYTGAASREPSGVTVEINARDLDLPDFLRRNKQQAVA